MKNLGLPLLLVLIGISAIGPLTLNGVLPATSQIMADLLTRYEVAQLVLTVFLFANLVSQLVLGPAADRYGRRPIMLMGLLVYIFGSLLCASAVSIEWLLAGRFIQGIGGAVCAVLPRAIVRDLHTQDRAASVIGYMTTAMMVAPLFGPALGGWITDQYSWRYMYVGLAVLGALLFVAAWRYQYETMTRAQVQRPAFLSSSAILIKHPGFFACLLMQAGTVGVYYGFLSGAPFVAMEARGLSASSYGVWFSIVAIGYLCGNLVAGKFSEGVGVLRMVQLGFIPHLIGLALFWLLLPLNHPAALFLPMLIIAFSNGISLPSMFTMGMSFRPDLAASASGLAGSAQTAFGVVLSMLVGYLLPFSTVWLFVVLSASGLLSVVGLMMTMRSAQP